MSVVFVSYRSRDRRRVRSIVDALIRCGHDVQFDRLSLKPSNPSYSTLASLIDASEYFLYFASSDGKDTPWMQWELDLAGALSRDRGKPTVVPVLFTGAVAPIALRGLTRIGPGKPTTAIAALKQWLGCNGPDSSPSAPVPSLVDSRGHLESAYVEALRIRSAPPETRRDPPASTFVTPALLPVDGGPTAEPSAWEALLEPGARSLILGDSGSGKSSSLQWLARNITNAAHEATTIPLLPILVPLHRVQTGARLDGFRALVSQVRDYLDITADEHSLGEWLKSFFETRKVVLLVDGLDVIDSSGALPDVVQWLGIILRTYPRTRLIATARERSAAVDDLNFAVYRLAPLREGAQRVLWDAFAPPGYSIDFTRPRTPLDLKTYAFAATRIGPSATRADCEREALTTLIQRSALDGDPHVEQLRSEIGYVALRSHVHDRATMGLLELCNWLDEFRRTDGWRPFPGDHGSPGSLSCLLRRGSVLRTASPTRSEVASVRFTHDHYRDCLAAEAIIHRWLPPRPEPGEESGPWDLFDLLPDYRALHRWRSVLRFWLLLHPDPVTAATELTAISDQEHRESRIPGAEIAMSAVLDEMVAADAHPLILTAFASAITLNWDPEQVPPAEPTLTRVAGHPFWSEQLLHTLSTIGPDLADVDEAAPLTLDLVQQWIADARSAAVP